jgi:putative phosphoribosyl transferase
MVERGLLDAETLVLGLPRGGVPVAARVAGAVGAHLDVFVVRKLGVPGHEEYAMGAIASGGIEVVNDEVIRRLGISRRAFDAVVEAETAELERRVTAYRGGRPPLDLAGRDVVLVDDGIATGATMRAAALAVRAAGARTVVVAVPVAPPSAAGELAADVDAFVAVSTPSGFGAVGAWYDDFRQTSDDEVRRLLGDGAD